MSCLMLSELPESEIETLRKQIQKRQKLFLVMSVLNSLPATASAHPLERDVTPGIAVAGNPFSSREPLPSPHTACGPSKGMSLTRDSWIGQRIRMSPNRHLASGIHAQWKTDLSEVIVKDRDTSPAMGLTEPGLGHRYGKVAEVDHFHADSPKLAISPVYKNSSNAKAHKVLSKRPPKIDDTENRTQKCDPECDVIHNSLGDFH